VAWVTVAFGDEPVSEPSAGEGVVVRNGDPGAQDSGELGGLLGVHDDLLVQLGAPSR
jgi:hypothetical protein